MNDNEKIDVSFVIPTINSEKFIGRNIRELENFIKKYHKINNYEIIIAAQTSKDKTFEAIQNLKTDKILPLFLIKKGKGVGLTAGFKKAKYDWILMTDDDLPYPFESMKKLFDKTNDFDVIIASRYVKKVKHKIPLIRRIASSTYLLFVKLFLGIPQKDIQAGMKLIKKEVFEKTAYPKETGYVWDTEMLCSANKKKFKITEIPVECVHKPNQVVVYKVAIPMLFGIIRVWWRRRLNG